MRIDEEMHFAVKAILFLACICLIALAGIHCGEGKDRAYSRGSTVIVAHPELDKGGLNPNGDTERYLVFLPLLKFNVHGEWEGGLARSWVYSPDYLEVTYHLRTDIRWHDGVPVTAHDIKFTLELMMHPDVLVERPGAFGSITVINDSTLRVGDFGLTDEVFWPRHLLERLEPREFYNWDFWKHPVGNGPYRFVRYLPQTMMEFEANPDYYRGKPSIERLILKFTGAAGLTELLSGNVDIVPNANMLDILKLKGDPRFRAYHSFAGWWLYQTIYWQHNHGLFRDSNVRRALTLAIDRRELLRVLNFPEDTPIVDGLYTLRQLRLRQFPEPLPYDPDRARALLEAAGWHDGDGDGIREQEDRTFRFTALVLSSPAFNEEMAVYIQDQLRQVGVRMDIQIMEWAAGMERVRTGEFEAVFKSFRLWDPLFSAPWSLLYQNTELVKLIDRAKVTTDPAAQDRIHREIMEIFRSDAMMTFLVPRMGVTFVHRRIQGLSTPWRASPLWYMEHLWVEDEEK